MQQNFPIVLLTFDRPAFFEQVARSLSEQVDANLSGRRIALFQDGAINRFSGIRRAKDDAIQANIEIFKRYFPGGDVFPSENNLGVALNFDRAERYVFEDLNQDAGLFFEDDLSLAPFYVNALDRLLARALRDTRIGYVSAYGVQGPASVPSNREPVHFTTLGHLWGFGLTRRLWLQNRRHVEAYLQIIRHADYRQRDDRAIYRLFTSWGMGCPASSQDCAKHLACVLNGAINLNTSISLARYIGDVGVHMERSLFDFVGYDRTELYMSALPELPELDQETAIQIGSVHWQWATEVAAPFRWEEPIPGLALWNFAVEMLRSPAVEAACIALQDRLGLSKCMLLFCCWHGHSGRQLSRSDLARAIGHLDLWENGVLDHMRSIRRALTGDIPFARSVTRSLLFSRAAYKFEVEAIKIGLAELQQLHVSVVENSRATRINLENYLSLSGVTGSATEIDTLVETSEALAGNVIERGSALS